VTGKVALDSNILVYAELEPDSVKGRRALDIIQAAAPRGVLAAQVLLEYLAVIRRRRRDRLADALLKVEAWAVVFEIAPTTNPIVERAARLVADHDFQVWDAVIWCAAQAAGARVLLSEDLHDGLRLGPLLTRNPFAMASAELTALIAP
jgi:predicted nucleic acid-binding protein